MPTYSIVMTMLPTVTLQDILGESVKQIPNLIPNKHLVHYNKKTTIIDYCQTINCSDHFLSTNLHFADYRSGIGHLQGGTSSC